MTPLEPTTSILVSLSALYDLAFATFHLLFWRLFAWPGSLKCAGPINVGITQTLNAMLTYCLAAYGGLMLWIGFAAPEAARIALAVGGGFWTLRVILQLVWFPRTRLSAGLSALFALGAIAHFALILPDGLAARATSQGHRNSSIVTSQVQQPKDSNLPYPYGGRVP